MKIPKQKSAAEFKELAVKRVKSGQQISAVVKELGSNFWKFHADEPGVPGHHSGSAGRP